MIIYGKRLLLYILEKYPKRLQKVYLAKRCEQKLFNKIKSVAEEVLLVDNKKAQALSRGGNHQGFIAEIEDLEFAAFSEVKKSDFLLVLYGITDVGNLGAIVRSAYALGVDAIIVSGVKSINLEAMIRTSSGAIFEMPIVLYSDTLSLINELKQMDFTIFGADMDGEDVRDISFGNKTVLIMGSEGEGIPHKLKSRLDKKISIKMKREFDSLNVSAATAILCDRIVNG